MNDQTFLQIQVLELQHLLDISGDDPILAPQMRERLDDAKRELQAVKQQPGKLLPKEIPVLPRAAIFMRGGGVQNSEGIRPGLAGEALIQYEKMFTEQAIHDERIAAKSAGRHRRPRGSSTPGLLFTGTPRGSFGLEFVPQVTEGDSLLAVHADSLGNIAEALLQVAQSDATPLDEIVAKIPPRVLQPMKQFLSTLAQYGAELRLAFSDRPAQSLSVNQVKSAADRLDREVSQDVISISGVFRGVTHESGYFDLKTDDQGVITGVVADSLAEEDLNRLSGLMDRPCRAELQKTTVRRITGGETASYVLLDAR